MDQQPTQTEPPSKRPQGLHLVATPIGNAADISLRALDVLRNVQAIACEDTRVTGKLMFMHGIGTTLLAYHEHNAERMRPKLIARLQAGEGLALVSDAGTPLVSDPGFKLVRECIALGLPVTALPGASATLTALQLSGLPPDRFLFAGFLPPRSSARRESLAELKAVPATLIFYESPRRLAESLEDMAVVLGDRPACVARELTKLFEEVRRDSLSALAAAYHESGPPKGEVVIVVGPPLPEAAGAAELESRLRAALRDHSLRDAADIVAAATGLKRREVYAHALTLARQPGPEDNE